jgi:hypothetical protein
MAHPNRDLERDWHTAIFLYPTLIDFALITSCWLLLITLMLVLQQLGYDFGFHVWPIGEVRNWLMFLHDGPGAEAAKLFWAIDNRNALAPWWYLAARPFIAYQPAAFLILHLATGLVAGLSTYLLFRELLSIQARLFAASVGTLVSLFIVTVYRDDIVWTQVGALSCTLLTVWSFLRSKASGGSTASWRGASLVFWLISISTYTLECGAVIGIFAISVILNVRNTGRNVKSVARCALEVSADVGPYVAVLIIYYMIWTTASAANYPGFTELNFSVAQLIKSLSFGLWHSDYLLFVKWAFEAGAIIDVIVFGIVALAGYALLKFVWGKSAQFALTWYDLFLVLVIGLSIVAPTILLESSSNIFVPGSRWRMVMQFWTPCLFCVLLALAIMILLRPDIRSQAWRGGTAIAAAVAVVLVLGFNRSQVIYTRGETRFFDELKSVVSNDRVIGATFPHYYFIRLDTKVPYFIGSNLEKAYARTVLPLDVRFRSTPAPSLPYEGPAIVFQENGITIGTEAMIPYQQISVLVWDGRTLTGIPLIDEQVAKEFRAGWTSGLHPLNLMTLR